MDQSKQPRKRKHSPIKQREAGAKKSRPTVNKQWTHPTLEPMVRFLTGNPSNNFQMRHDHHSILQTPLQPNVLNKETLFSHFEITAPYTVGLPVPIHTTTGPVDTLPDLMVRFLFAKKHFRHELSIVQTAFNRIKLHRSPPGVDLQTKEEDFQNSAAVVYAALLDRDPDPYLLLDSGYDYHFTGGSLATLSSLNDGGPVATVFNAVGENLEDVEVIELVHSEERTHDEITARKLANCPTCISGPILEIMADRGGRCVLVRKRHAIVILREVASERQQNGDNSTGSSNDTEWRAVQRIFSSVPFASVCIVGPQSFVKRTITICTTDYQRKLRLWQIEQKQEAEVQFEEKMPCEPEPTTVGDRRKPGLKEDNWSAVRCINGRSLVACLVRHGIYLYSVRERAKRIRDRHDSSTDEEAEYTMHLMYRGCSNFSRWTLPCERSCALEVAPAEGLIFVATCHKLFVAKVDSQQADQGSGQDSDHGNGLLKVNVLLVFAHNLRQRPVFLSHQKQCPVKHEGDSAGENEEHFLLFGSHLPMSYGVCSFTKSLIVETEGQNVQGDTSVRSKYFTRHLPLHPRTFNDAYKLALSKGFCLSANEPLKRRFYACQSGLALVPAGKGESGKMHIILQTSGGDLLQQNIFASRPSHTTNFSRESKETEQVVETLRRWHEKLLEGSEPPPYKATNFRTLHKLRDILNCPRNPNELKDLVFRPPNEAKLKANKDAALCRRKRLQRSTARSRRRSASLSSESSSDASMASDQAAEGTKWSKKWFAPKVRDLLPWRQTLEEIQQYKDYLAPALLAVWSDGKVRSATLAADPIPTKLPPYEDLNQRIGSWMDTTLEDRLTSSHEDACTIEPKEETLSQLQSEQDHEPKPAPTSNPAESLFNSGLNSFSQETFGNHRTMSVPLTQESEAEVERKPSTNVRPAKKKYVKGF